MKFANQQQKDFASNYFMKRADRLASYALMSAGLLLALSVSLLIYYVNHH